VALAVAAAVLANGYAGSDAYDVRDMADDALQNVDAVALVVAEAVLFAIVQAGMLII
jgi:hypothetical protein